jgi:hypothetical protein
MGYPVNGVPVSDFYTPRYFDPVEVDQTRFSFTGALERPLQILPAGYLSWIDPADSGLYRLDGGQREPELVANLAQLASSTAPLRTVVDANPQTPQVTQASLMPAPTAFSAHGSYDAVAEASRGAGLRTAEALVSLAGGTGAIPSR